MADLRVWVARVFSLGAICSCAKQHPNAHVQPTATEIVAAMASTYEHASSYVDRGVVTTSYTGSVPHTVRAPFETTYIRSVGFRFEYRNGYDRRPAVVWTGEGKVHRYWVSAPIEDESNLASAAFYSAVPSLLLRPLAPGPTVADLQHLRVDGNEPIDGHPCWRVVGAQPRGDELTLWIDQATHVLRRTSSRNHFPAAIETDAFDTEKLTSYKPVLNETVDSTQVSGPDPSSIAKPRVDPWLGVQLDGTRIARVVGGSPADRSGLHAGDELVSVDGTPITDGRALVEHVAKMKIDAPVVLVVRVAGIERSITAAVGDRGEFVRQQGRVLDKPAPPFTATAASGTYPADLGALAGNLVVLDFASTTLTACADCGTPTSFLSKLQDKYGDRGVRVVQLSTEDAAVLQKYASDHQLHYTLAHDDGRIADAYHVIEPSTLIVIDQAGVARFAASWTSGLEMDVQYLLDQEGRSSNAKR